MTTRGRDEVTARDVQLHDAQQLQQDDDDLGKRITKVHSAERIRPPPCRYRQAARALTI